VGRSEDGAVTVRVLAGEALGARAVIDTRTPIVYLHYTLRPGGRVRQPIPASYTACAYVFAGDARVGPDDRRVGEAQLAIFGDDGDEVTLAAPSVDTQVLLLAGEPLREPVARYGPFVMNTPGEIRQALLDYQAGRLG
jgi:hypothetical protein